MLIAEIRRKLSDLDDLKIDGQKSIDRLQDLLSSHKEDILTADVFGAIKYLPRRPYLQQVLQRVAVNNPHSTAFEKCLSQLPFCEDDFTFRFWPNYPTPTALDGQRTEPDVEIETSQMRIFVEAKLHSGFGDSQILRQLLIGLADATREFFLLLLTKGVRTPRLSFNGTWYPVQDYLKHVAPTLDLSPLQRDKLLNAHQRILWINWRTIGAALQQAHRGESNSANHLRCGDILSDLNELLALRSLAPFQGFSRTLPTVAPHRPVCFRFRTNPATVKQHGFQLEWLRDVPLNGTASFRCPIAESARSVNWSDLVANRQPAATSGWTIRSNGFGRQRFGWQSLTKSPLANELPTSLWRLSAPQAPFDFRQVVQGCDHVHTGPLLLRTRHA